MLYKVHVNYSFHALYNKIKSLESIDFTEFFGL